MASVLHDIWQDESTALLTSLALLRRAYGTEGAYWADHQGNSKEKHDSAARKKIDSVFDHGEKLRLVTTKLINPKTGVALQLWQDAGAGKCRYLVFYRPPSGTSTAIEPWTGAPNAANNGMGLIILKPGGRFRASYGVSFKSTR